MVGSSAPFKPFDPLGFAAKADEKTLKKYRERYGAPYCYNYFRYFFIKHALCISYVSFSELKHGRTAMLAVLGWFTQVMHFHKYDELIPTR